MNKKKSIITVTKRDGRTVPFELNKVTKAIELAFKSIHHTYIAKDLDDISNKVFSAIKKQLNEKSESIISVEQIQDIVEDILMKSKKPDVAKEYIRYRAKRTQIRDANNDLMKLYEEIYASSAEDMELKRDNANINGNTTMCIMLKCGSEGNKYFLLNHFLKPEYANAHRDGYIHMHDLDFSLASSNCLQINLEKLFNGGFNTGHGYLREPNSIRSYAALSCIAVQSNQNEQFGGQSINAYDYYMAPGVRKSFMKSFKHNLEIAGSLIVKDEDVFDKLLENKNLDDFPKYKDEDSLEEFTEKFLETFDDEDISAKMIRKSFKFAFKQATKDTEEETKQAMEAVIHNFNTLQSRAGSQVPFSSLNLGTDTSSEGRLVTDKLLDALYAGLGHGETSIFPIVVFKVKDGVNFYPNDPNYDLYKKAIKCSAKRLFPTYMNLSATYNAQYYVPGNIQSETATMGCRTRVMGNVNGPEESGSRGNFAFTTLNLPMYALEAEGSIDKFFQIMDKYIQLAHDYLLERFNIIANKHVYNFPFLMGEHLYMGSEHLRNDDIIFEALKHSSLSIGFVGLAECLKVLTGHHHGESEEAQNLGLIIISHLRAMTDKYINMDHLNWSTFATPAESTAGRMCKLTREKFGIIEGVTDRDYFTNSSHVPVWFKIKAVDKIRIEAPYHPLCNAGCIAYIEFDGDATKNLQAFEDVLKCMHDNNMNYYAINTKSADYCPICGNASYINDACPICGYHEHVDSQDYKVSLIQEEGD